MWYPENRHKLNSDLKEYLKTGKHKGQVNGLIVPHAGYIYSGSIAGLGFSLIKKDSIEKAIIIGPSHYVPLKGLMTTNLKKLKTPLGVSSTFIEKGFEDIITGNIEQEHSIDNQIPFLQKIGIKKIMPIMIGEISGQEAKDLAEKLSRTDSLLVFSTDLSHFLPYDEAKDIDNKTIDIIKDLDLENFNKIDACGRYPLLILMHLCKIRDTKPVLMEYKNSGDITGDKSNVVGYASFYF